NDRPELVKPYYAKKGFVDQARIVSHESSDPQDGQFCWGQIALGSYLNLPATQAALHVRQPAQGGIVKWNSCSVEVGGNFVWEYFDMRPFFDQILEKVTTRFKFLIYNGDIDTTANFISAQTFIERLASDYGMKIQNEYKAWK
ncbi:hypothetical protein PFISCL1PPCAC_24830, partial [Pristionchus fissidentatus]